MSDTVLLAVDTDESSTPAAGDKKLEEHNKVELVVTDVGPNLNRLWSYQSSKTKGHNVSCICWNSTNPVCKMSNSFNRF